MKGFLAAAQYQGNPLTSLVTFLQQQQQYETAGLTDKMRFVGYVLEIGYDAARIITSDPYKRAVGGIPRGSFLIMVPDNLDGVPPHFTLLRVQDVAPTPLGSQVQQTYFELHKKSMPELDVWTQSELQWGALNTAVLGMFYPDRDDSKKLVFSGDVNTVVSAHRYRIYAPDEALLNLITNGIVPDDGKFEIGALRPTECQLPFATVVQPKVPVTISATNLRGFRTAMFGKTRLGKSNVVKLIAQAIIETTTTTHNVGQLIFDLNGEYANDNPQDGNRSLRSAYATRCHVYALTPRSATPSSPLKLNFYEQPDTCLPILADLLEQANLTSQYIKAFASVGLSAINGFTALPSNQQTRMVRKIQIFWAILYKAGYLADEPRLRALNLHAQGQNAPSAFNPALRQDLRDAAWKNQAPSPPNTLTSLLREFEAIADFLRANDGNGNSLLQSTSGNDLFDADDKALLRFLKPSTGGGPIILQPFRKYHDPQASDVVKDILKELDAGMTVILDLGSATDSIRRYFSDLLSRGVFAHQEDRFTSNNLGNHYIQLYFEEAHNLFPRDAKDLTDAYSRFAKEGAKFHIGMVYSTQSPSTISKDLLAQTENFFVAHLSSQDETRALTKEQVQFTGLEDDIMRARTPGYIRMLSFSNRFVIPVQAHKFEAVAGTTSLVAAPSIAASPVAAATGAPTPSPASVASQMPLLTPATVSATQP